MLSNFIEIEYVICYNLKIEGNNNQDSKSRFKILFLGDSK